MLIIVLIVIAIFVFLITRISDFGSSVVTEEDRKLAAEAHQEAFNYRCRMRAYGDIEEKKDKIPDNNSYRELVQKYIGELYDIRPSYAKDLLTKIDELAKEYQDKDIEGEL